MPQAAQRQAQPTLRHDWKVAEVETLFNTPFMELMWQAQQVHRHHFDPSVIQASSLLNIKTGGCAENCGYCSQSAHHEKKVKLERDTLMEVDLVVAEAKKAKDGGATRFCMGAAWRSPKERDFVQVLDMIKGVKDLGLETCVTLGMLDEDQTERLKQAGLDYYNHNLDTSPDFYGEIITTRTYQDRLDTLTHVRDAGIKVCAGGIIGMGEGPRDRASLLHQLATLPSHPDSVPINQLVQVAGTPLDGVDAVDPFDFVRTIAVARILMPQSHVRLSAGRTEMNDELQALCFLAGANSIFYGEKLLTTDNPNADHDMELFARLGLHAEEREVEARPVDAADSGEAGLWGRACND